MRLLVIAVAPVFIVLFYVYFRDKYEHEPLGMLLKALGAGILITIPISFVEQGLSNFAAGVISSRMEVVWSAFVVAGGTEELFKYIALYLLIWANKNFNERFDGIVYAVFVSLGFAMVENLLYVLQGGFGVGWIRALTAIPAHTFFGITMGFYFGIARFSDERARASFMIRALLWPIILHGFYDFCLMSGIPILLLIFIPFIVYLWIQSFQKMKKLSDASSFRPLE